MAVNATTNVAQRRVFYGANVALQIALVVAVVAGVIYLTRDKGQVDLTRSGVNSLSPRTRQLVHGLDQNVTITAVYTVLSEYDELAQKRRDMVADLLKLYESAAGGKITANLIDPMKDQARLPLLLKRLREKPAYQNEAKLHQEALQQYPEFNKQVLDLIDQQKTEIDRLMQFDASLQTSLLGEIAQELERLRRTADATTAEVQELVSTDIPRYGQAVESVRRYAEAAQRWFQAVDDWVKNKAASASNVPPAALGFMQQANGQYQTLLTEVNALLERVRDLKRTEMEQVSDQLNRWPNAPPIIVESDKEARIVPFFEVWPMQGNPMSGSDGDPREFAGEQCVSSAILKLTQTQKTAIVFTRWGGESPIVPDFSQFNMTRQMPQAPFGVLNDLLTKENFVTQDWDVKAEKVPPKAEEDVARTIYVVFPPEPPPPSPDPRRPSPEAGISPEDVRLIWDTVQQAGKAIFLTGAASRMMGGAGVYEFGEDLKKTWGIEVDPECVAVRFMPSPENPSLFVPRRPPVVLDTSDSSGGVRLTDNEITAPLQTSIAGFPMVCPLKIVAPATQPEGLKVSPLAVVESTTDVWAVRDLARLDSELQSKRGTKPYDDDLRPPFPIAVAAENGAGQRIVVIASRDFASNNLLEAGGMMLTGSGLVPYKAYPANPDLFINAVHWLTNESNRISVGARQTAVPRLDKLKEGPWLNFWRIFLVGIWPGLALVVGGGVWLFRRR